MHLVWCPISSADRATSSVLSHVCRKSLQQLNSKVSPDLQLKQYRGSCKVSDYAQELLVQFQSGFFSEAKSTLPGKRKKRRTAKCPWAVSGQRKAALAHIQTLDHQLELTLGAGLKAFAGGVGDQADHALVAVRFLLLGVVAPTMILHLDEGSPAYSMCWYLVHAQQLRLLPVRDIYHRE